MKKNKVICPNCGKELKSDKFEDINAYHNAIDFRCKLCGYENHWTTFYKHKKK